MRHNLNLYMHLWDPEINHTNSCPNGLVIRHPFLEVLLHESECIFVEGTMVGVDPVYVLPSPLTAGVAKGQIDVRKCLGDLSLDVFWYCEGL